VEEFETFSATTTFGKKKKLKKLEKILKNQTKQFIEN
jgi:hypothetical protein